ncbi:MAG TPA: TonB-dependent receptor [Bacteroidia bacterium]
MKKMKPLLFMEFPEHWYKKSCLIIIVLLITSGGFSQEDSTISIEKLKQLSLEELMNIEVTSVSKRPEKLKDVASAIQVISSDDIKRSGAKTVAEALRLASNLQVAQVNSSQWAISARGFNNVLANKLLVLIDGRTVYTPLYAGVFWDIQNLLLEDIDRIEVISGPGGALWGANAVNGVINIITKKAKDTKGLYAEGSFGNSMLALDTSLFGGIQQGSIRLGSELSKNLFCRVYGTGFKMGTTVDTNGVGINDNWKMAQGGFRMDWDPTEKDQLSLQGNIYHCRPNPDSDSIPLVASGDNALLQWNHKVSDKFDFQFKAYYDHTWRDFQNKFTEDLKTFDIDWQNRIQIADRHTFTYGLGFRQMDHKVTNLPLFTFNPGKKTLYLFSGFLQYEIIIIKEQLKLTLGTKVEHNSYTQYQYQPNGRITWTPTKKQTIWAAASRAVRNPARIDRDFALYLFPNFPLIMGSDSFTSENVIAYELGWRSQPVKSLSLSVSTFYNVYDNIRTAEPGTGPLNYPITFANGVQGETWGAELSITNELSKWCHLRGGYTFLRKDLKVKSTSKDLNNGTAESNDPEHQFLIQPTFDLPENVQCGAVFRYVSQLPKPEVPYYMGLDFRIAWKPIKNIELSVVGQNLLDIRHREFIASTPVREIERSIYGKIVCRF